MAKVKEFISNFKDDPGHYLRLWFLGLCGVAVIAFGVFCAVRAITFSVAQDRAAEADAIVDTSVFTLKTAEKHQAKNFAWCTYELSLAGQPVAADFSGKVAAAHGGVLNDAMLLEQFEQYKAGSKVKVRYVYSDVSDTYYLLEVVGPGAAAD